MYRYCNSSTENFEILEIDLLINGISIMKEIEIFLQAKKSRDFKLYGNYISKRSKRKKYSSINKISHLITELQSMKSP
jgi:hypothetical protein